MKLKFRTKLSYGIGGTADNAMFTLIETFLFFFLTTVVDIETVSYTHLDVYKRPI